MSIKITYENKTDEHKMEQLPNIRGSASSGNTGGSSGGVTSWNELKDRPFGEEIVCETLVDMQTVEFTQYGTGYPWEASLTGLTQVQLRDSQYLRITWDGAVYILKMYYYEESSLSKRYCGNVSLFFSEGDLPYCENVDDTTTPFCAWHWYHGKTDLMFVSADDKPSHTIKVERVIEQSVKTLDPKYLPEALQFGEEAVVVIPEQTLTGFEMMNDVICVVVDPFIFNMSVGEMYTIIWDGISYECMVEAFEGFEGMPYLGNMNYVMMQSGGDIPFALIFDDCIFVATEKMGSHTISIKRSENRQIDPKYIPDSIARVSDIPDIPDISIPDPTWESLPDKPFYEDFSGECLIKGYRFEGTFEMGSVSVEIPGVQIHEGITYTVKIDGKIFTNTAELWREEGVTYYVGFIGVMDDKTVYLKSTSNGIELTYTDGVVDGVVRDLVFSMWVGNCKVGKTLDEKYIPDTIARMSDIPDHTWESLHDKPFGDEPNWVSIADNLELEFVQYTTPGPTGVPPYGAYFTGIQRNILNNTSHLRVTWDGEVYILPKYNAFYGSDAVGYCGNVSLYFYGDEGEGEVENMDDTRTPFFVYYMRGYNPTSVNFYTLDTSSSHTVTVEYVGGYTAVPLDEKYIPDSIARVSDITAAITGAMEASY